MIYRLETIPMVLFSKIVNTGNLTLLSDENIDNDKLKEIWDKLREEYQKHDNNIRINKIERLRKKISIESGKYETIRTTLKVLEYGKDDEMVELLEKYGYKINGNFVDGIILIYKQIQNLENKIVSLKKELLTYFQDNEKNEISIYEILVNLNVALGGIFDVKTVTVIEYIYYKKALKNKK